MKKILKNVCVFLLSALIALGVGLSLFFTRESNSPPPMSVYELENDQGELVKSVKIEEVTGVHTLSVKDAVNYTPNEFLFPVGMRQNTVYDTPNAIVTERGTYQIVIQNIDPTEDAETRKQKTEALAPCLTDLYWHFTLYIPQVWSACQVYVGANVVAKIGTIKGYNETLFVTDGVTYEVHTDGTEPTFLDITFNSQVKTMVPDPLSNANKITIHYESTGSAKGITDDLLFGFDADVRAAVQGNSTMPYAVLLAAGFMCGLLIFLSLLKRTMHILPEIGMTAFILIICLSEYLLAGTTTAPFALYNTLLAFFILLPIAAALSFGKFSSAEIRYAYLPFALCAACFGIFAPTAYAILAPELWLCVVLLALVTAVALREFINLEIRNKYLTHNLQSEVERQTESLQELISARDDLLRYISHDLRRPVQQIEYYNKQLRTCDDAQRAQIMETIDSKIADIQADISELRQFSKLNFMAEVPTECDIQSLISAVFDEQRPDCVAHGVRLNKNVSSIKVYAKRTAFLSVFNNLIFNAIDHAECNEITISAARHRNRCEIKVIDNGKGLANEQEAFLPYRSGSNSGYNLGLGLYLCKQHIENMGGTLSYSRENGMTVFTVSLPLA